MVVFLTSSPTGPLDNSRAVDGIDDKNSFPENLRKCWKPEMKTLYITAMPSEPAINEEIRKGMAETFGRRGFYFASAEKGSHGVQNGFDIWDDRTEDFSKEVLHSYDLIILGGGHVPTQNAFFQRIGLREKIQGFEGVILGISAGTMNSADVVYAQPELEGEAVDPKYQRYLTGLGLTKTQVLPHYQMIKDCELDGMRVFEDITYGDSMGREFVALPDGSYILIADGEETIWGEAYRIKDGALQQICRENEKIVWMV